MAGPEAFESLVPTPKRVEAAGAPFRLAAGAPFRIALGGGADARGARPLLEAVPGAVVAADDPAVVLELRAGATPAEGYRLDVDARGARIVAGDPAGLFYGARTLAQWARRAGADLELPGVSIVDEPDFPHRGFLLDVSRDRVPTMETLRALVDLLAGLKMNQLQLYTEHAFAYEGHEEVWRDASPITPEEVRELDRYARDRFVELVPNQQSFGHMHRWLVRDRYAPLAECPEGIEHAFSLRPEPFSLCPTDGRAFELLDDLFDQLLPCFSSALFNVGLDETFDLGKGRSHAACEERGTGRVYIDHLRAVHARVAARGHRMQFWGDIIVNHPELVPELPRDAIALEWGYEAGHPFEEHARLFAGSGLDFYVCPGTSSWQSLLGRVDNARANLSEAAVRGREAGASGYLVTDWGDYGHWQPLPVSWPGIVLGACHGWTAGAEPADLAAVLSRGPLADPSGVAGRALLDLGRVYLDTDARSVNGSPLFFLLRYAEKPLPLERVEGLTVAGMDAARDRLDSILSDLRSHSMAGPAGDLVVDELTVAADISAWAARLGRARAVVGEGSLVRDVPRTERAALAADLRPLVERHREVWTGRSRPGGLDDSAGRLESLLAELGEPVEEVA